MVAGVENVGEKEDDDDDEGGLENDGEGGGHCCWDRIGEDGVACVDASYGGKLCVL